MARRHIRMANVVLLVLDGTEKVAALDATIAGYADEEGRALILVVNKWDVAGEKGKRKFTEEIRDELKFLWRTRPSPLFPPRRGRAWIGCSGQ